MNIQNNVASIKLYDITANPDPLPTSPNTLKTRIALNVKGIPYETVWLNLLEVRTVIPELTKTGKPPTVPVIVDLKNENRAVQDSWEIAKYLDSFYPGSPPLIKKDNEGLEFFLYQYCHERLLIHFFRLCILENLQRCPTPDSQKAFREYIEAKFNTTLEKLAGDPSAHLAALKSQLRLIHETLQLYPYLSGETVGFADVTLAAFFTMVANLRSDLFETSLLNIYSDNTLRAWWNRMEKYTKLAPPLVDSRL